MPTPIEALDALKAGNSRFLQAVRESGSIANSPKPVSMSGAQKPFAIILGCSDSRAPAEYIFDQGFGDLFIVRIAGNIAGPSQLGSIEFAVETFGSPLIVVLGHTNCGAIAATIGALQNPETKVPENLHPIVEPITSAIAPLIEAESEDQDVLITKAIRANVFQAVEQLKSGSDAISAKLATNEVMLVGAVYSLETGAVEFIDHANG